MLRISVKQAPNHPLILRVVFPRFVLEKLNAALAQGEGDLYSFIPKDEILGAREKVRDDL